MKIQFTVNKKKYSLDVSPMTRLLDALRNNLGLTGAKEGCGEGECGACSVIVDGEVVNSCLIPVCQVQKSTIKTVEGLSSGENLTVLQESFTRFGGAQCGICTPGILLATQNFLDLWKKKKGGKVPGEAEIREALAGNLCRCTGYTKIFLSVKKALRNTPRPERN